MWRGEGEKTDESRVKREWRLGIKGSMGDPFEEFCSKVKQRDGAVAGRGCGIRRGVVLKDRRNSNIFLG